MHDTYIDLYLPSLFFLLQTTVFLFHRDLPSILQINSCVDCTLLGRGLLSIHFSLVGKKMLPYISIFIFIPCHLVLCSFSRVSVPPIVLTTLMCKHSWRWSAFWKQYGCNLFQIVFTLPNKWHLHFQRKTKKLLHIKLHVKGKSNSPTQIFHEKQIILYINPF